MDLLANTSEPEVDERGDAFRRHRGDEEQGDGQACSLHERRQAIETGVQVEAVGELRELREVLEKKRSNDHHDDERGESGGRFPYPRGELRQDVESIIEGRSSEEDPPKTHDVERHDALPHLREQRIVQLG
jgi:hypothetical protein